MGQAAGFGAVFSVKNVVGREFSFKKIQLAVPEEHIVPALKVNLLENVGLFVFILILDMNYLGQTVIGCYRVVDVGDILTAEVILITCEHCHKYLRTVIAEQ